MTMQRCAVWTLLPRHPSISNSPFQHMIEYGGVTLDPKQALKPAYRRTVILLLASRLEFMFYLLRNGQEAAGNGVVRV